MLAIEGDVPSSRQTRLSSCFRLRLKGMKKIKEGRAYLTVTFDELVESADEIREGRPFLGLVVPALHHQFEQFGSAIGRHLQPLPIQQIRLQPLIKHVTNCILHFCIEADELLHA